LEGTLDLSFDRLLMTMMMMMMNPDVFIYTYEVQRKSKEQQFFITQNYILGRHVSTLSESSSGPLILDLYFIGPEDDSERVETCRPKIAFYVLKLLCF